MKRFSPNTRNLGGRHLVSKIISNHQKNIRNIQSSFSVSINDEYSRHMSTHSSCSQRGPKKLLRRKMSTDCYEPQTYSLSSKISKNKRKRKNYHTDFHENELKILQSKIRSMNYSWFSISDYIFNPD